MSGLRLGALGASLCLLAGAFAVPSLYVPGVALLLLSCCAWMIVSAAFASARVRLELADRTIEEESTVPLTVCVDGRLAGLCAARLRPAPQAPWRPLGAHARPARLELRALRRGRLVVGPATLRYSDPFGLCVRERVSPTRELLVLPRVEPVRAGDLELVLSHPIARHGHEDGLDFDGLRPHRPGAPASRIHWLTAARTGTLVERRIVAESVAAPVTLVLDTRGWAGSVQSEALDMAVRAAASLCAGLARMVGCALLLPGRERAEEIACDMSAWPRVHAQLALVQANREPRWSAIADARRVVLVHAGELRLERGAGGVVLTVSPAPRAGQGVLFTVAGCAVQPAPAPSARRVA